MTDLIALGVSLAVVVDHGGDGQEGVLTGGVRVQQSLGAVDHHLRGSGQEGQLGGPGLGQGSADVTAGSQGGHQGHGGVAAHHGEGVQERLAVGGRGCK